MIDTKTAPSSAATLAEAAETAACDTATASTSYFTHQNAARQGRIAALLMAGEQNAISARDLVILAGFKDSRSLRVAIDREREKSVICASDDGYFLPAPGRAGIPDLRKYLRRMDQRAASNRRSVRTARALLRDLEKTPLDGQITFEERGAE